MCTPCCFLNLVLLLAFPRDDMFVLPSIIGMWVTGLLAFSVPMADASPPLLLPQRYHRTAAVYQSLPNFIYYVDIFNSYYCFAASLHMLISSLSILSDRRCHRSTSSCIHDSPTKRWNGQIALEAYHRNIAKLGISTAGWARCRRRWPTGVPRCCLRHPSSSTKWWSLGSSAYSLKEAVTPSVNQSPSIYIVVQLSFVHSLN